MGQVIGGGLATLLTLLILSRAVADNPAYRLALHLLVGLSLGYIAAVLLRSAIILPLQAVVLNPTNAEGIIVLGAGLVLIIMLGTRFRHQSFSSLANYPLALLFGVGAALVLLGAVRGTLVPQLLSTMRLPGFVSGDVTIQIGTVVVAALTIITLLSFTYATQTPASTSNRRVVGLLGRGLILVAFGVFWAAAVTTYVAALTGQLRAIIDWVRLLVGAP